MDPPDTKRQKLDGTDNSKVETVELDMTQDAVPLEIKELTHMFMKDISSLEDAQLTACVPKTLKLLKAFRETKDQGLQVGTSKLNEMLLTALFSEARLQTSAKILSEHPWGVKNPSLKLFTLLKFEDYDWVNLSPLAIMETVLTEGNAEKEILSAAAEASSTTASIGETCAEKLILATHKKIEAGEATKTKLEGSAYTSFSRLSTLFGAR